MTHAVPPRLAPRAGPSARREPGRMGAAILIAAALLLFSTASSPPSAAAAEGCDVKASLVDGPQTDDVLDVREWEDFVIWGSGYPADSTVTLVFESVDGSTPIDVTTDALGEFAEPFFFERGSAGTTWSVQPQPDPLELCPVLDAVGLEVLPASPFTDTADHVFDIEVSWLYQVGITNGCSADRFCPDAPVTREQMASFLSRALGLPAAGADYFTDDEASFHEPDINRLAEAGITNGCGAGIYCPTSLVTREQMASFLARAFALPPSATDYFTDDEASFHEADINRLAEAGLTNGCGAGRYCPTQFVTRGQMAAFLYRAIYIEGILE
jgi:hypothetical protein